MGDRLARPLPVFLAPVMGSCGFGTCTDPTCYLCTRVAKLPQPPTAMDAMNKLAEKNAARDGVFDAVAHDVGKLKKKRSRQGASYVPRHLR